MVHSHQLFSQPKTIAIANRINWVVLYPMDAFIPAFCNFVYKHMWMNRNRNRNSLEKSRCDSSIKVAALTISRFTNLCSFNTQKMAVQSSAPCYFHSQFHLHSIVNLNNE